MMQFLLAFILVGFSWAGPFIVGKGAGEAEYAITFSRAYLPELLNSCLGPCALSSEETALLKEMVELAKTPPQMEFKDDKASYIFEYLPDQHRVIFNRNELKSLNEVQAVQLWVGVLGKQLKAGRDLSPLLNELQRILQVKMASSRLILDGQKSFQAMVWADHSSRLYIRDAAFNNYDVTAQLAHLTQCPAVEKIQILSLRWEPVKVLADGHLELGLSATQTWRCGKKSERSRVRLTMKALAPDDQLDPQSIRAHLEGE